jgi:hypothetical protein
MIAVPFAPPLPPPVDEVLKLSERNMVGGQNVL